MVNNPSADDRSRRIPRGWPRELILLLGVLAFVFAIGMGVKRLWAAAHWPGAFEAWMAAMLLAMVVVVPAAADRSARTVRVLSLRVVVVALGMLAIHYVRPYLP